MKSTSKTRNLRIAGAKRMVREIAPGIGFLAVMFYLLDGITDGQWDPTSILVAGLMALLVFAAYGYIKNPEFARDRDSEPEP